MTNTTKTKGRFARFAISALAVIGMAFGGSLSMTAVSQAMPNPGFTPYDPYTPIPAVNWCPGGGTSGGWGGYCEGINFPDGSRWNIAWANAPFAGTVYQPMKCIIHTGNPVPPLAGPWGCGRGNGIGAGVGSAPN
ncbi:MAG: hypothetical protein ACKOB8_09905 [Mycobacterium sp.]